MVLLCKQDLINAGVLDIDVNNMSVLVKNSFTYNEARWVSAYWDKKIGVYRIALSSCRVRHMPTAVYPRLVYCWTHPTVHLSRDLLVLPLIPYTGDKTIDLINADTLLVTPKQKGKRNKHKSDARLNKCKSN